MWLVVAYLLCVLILTIVSFVLMFHPRCKSLEYTRKVSLERGEFDDRFLLLNWQNWSFDSPHGYTLKGQYLRGEKGAPAALFVHGITGAASGWQSTCSHLLIAAGVWQHSISQVMERAKHRSVTIPPYGYYEKDDIKAAVQALHQCIPDAPLYGLFGESLGAASALEYAPLVREGPNKEIDFIVADCPFSSALDELYHEYQVMHIPNCIAWPAGQLTRLFVRFARGFDLKNASPAQAVLQTDLPILFAHGMDDNYVPTIMSVHMVSARIKQKKGHTELVLIPGALHAEGILIDKPDGLQQSLHLSITLQKRKQKRKKNKKKHKRDKRKERNEYGT